MTEQAVRNQPAHRWYMRPVREFVERAVSTKETWWGYDTLQIDDPDGNELLFPFPE